MLSALSLVWMILTDFYHRRVSFYLIVTFGVLQAVWGEGENFIVNFLIVTLMLCGSWYYLKFKNRNTDFRCFMGEGDILFIYCLTPTLAPQLFIHFLIAALLLSLLYPKQQIPLVTTIGTLYLIPFFYEEILPNSTSLIAILLR